MLGLVLPLDALYRPLTFQTSILCQRIGIAKDGFYSSMREGHKYDASNFEYLDKIFKRELVNGDGGLFSDSSIPYSQSPINTASADADVDPDAPICIGMDYNANINWIVAGQPRDRRLNVIKSFYVKFDRKIPALVEDFCRYYAAHLNKTVVYYYDATALGSNYAVNDQDFHYNVVKEFERRGWRIESVYLGIENRRMPIKQTNMRQTRCATTRSTFSSTTPLPGSKGSCRSSTARTMKTLSSPFSQPVSAEGATASERISPAKSSRSPKKTCSNTAPMAQMLSILSTSDARSSRITIPSRCQ